jgi:large subunit ribosomal protein L5e
MVFVKVVKTNSYFKRYQTKPRRRREAKTDYHARRSMIQQDKNKYETKKYRFVVRKTNAKIICQIVTAHPKGDRIEYQAESSELKKFGLTAGLTNYAAAYATGLLLARRVLKDKKMETLYEGVKGQDIDGDYFDIYKDDGALIAEERRPFKCILDIGIYRATTGNKVFGALKGFTDGGVHVKHNNKRFPGFKVILPTEKGDKKKETFDPEIHKNKIFGTYINEHIESFPANPEYNKQQFSQWKKCIADNKVKTLKDLYTKVHEAIRKNPERDSNKLKEARKAKEAKAVRKAAGKGVYTDSKGRKWIRYQKLTNQDRKDRVAAKLASIIAEVADRK